MGAIGRLLLNLLLLWVKNMELRGARPYIKPWKGNFTTKGKNTKNADKNLIFQRITIKSTTPPAFKIRAIKIERDTTEAL